MRKVMNYPTYAQKRRGSKQAPLYFLPRIVTTSLRWIIAATLIMAAALGIGRFAYTPLLPPMLDAFGWSFAQAGDVASANFFGYMIGALLAPTVSSSRYIRVWVAVSLMSSVATTYAGSSVVEFESWLLVRFLSGVASAFCLVLVTTQLLQVLDRQGQASWGNIHFAGVGLGIMVCMLVLHEAGDVAAQWQNLGAAAAVLMVVAWFALSGTGFVDRVAVGGDSMPETATSLWRLILGYGFFGYGYVVSATFVVAMAQQIQTSGQVTQDASWVWMVVGVALVPSVYIWQLAANRWGLLRVLRLAYLVESVGALMTALSESLYMLVVSCVLLGGTFAAITALGISAAKQLAPTRVAQAVSAMTFSFAVGQLLGPAISGRLADYFGGFIWPATAAAALLVISGLLVQPEEET